MGEHVKREFLKRGLSKPKQLSFSKMGVRSFDSNGDHACGLHTGWQLVSRCQLSKC